MTMAHVGAVIATIAGVVTILLHSSIHKIEEGHLAVYYRYCILALTYCWAETKTLFLFRKWRKEPVIQCYLVTSSCYYFSLVQY